MKTFGIRQAVVYFDCDDTLVLWNTRKYKKAKSIVVMDENGIPANLIPHVEHIKALKRHYDSGHCIVVWSMAGADWAQRVVKALKLELYVDLVISKPDFYYDDLPSSEWMFKPRYIKYKG